VAQKDVPVEVQAIGTVEAYSTVSVKAQISGPLQRVHFREGDYVKAGDLLFTIDPSPFEATLNEAQANVARYEAQLAQAEATLKRDRAQATYTQAQAARYSSLYQQGILSKDQTEQVQANADALAQGLRADEAAIKSAEAAVVAGRAAAATAKIQLGYTTIRSPIEGRTGMAPVKEGNLVAANTSELTTINQVQPTYVTFSVPEANLAALKKYMAEGRLPVFARAQEGTGEQESGVLTFVDNTVDPGTGTIKLKGTFPNPNRKLWPGEFVRVTLRLAVQRGAAVVPASAVQIGQSGAFVYVVRADNTVEARPVGAGARVEQDIVVESGLRSGEQVVTEGQLRLAPGMRVRIRGAGAGGPRGGPRS
jgi:multidrug efflux system membrane fusion protein